MLPNKNRLGYRDQHYLEHHRTWGALPAFDIDLVEYNYRDEPVLLTELKHGRIRYVDLDEHEIRCMRNLAREIPAVVIVYYHFDANDHLVNGDDEAPIVARQYYCIPANGPALAHLPSAGRWIHERAMVQWLHELRGMRGPQLLPELYLEQFSDQIRLMAKPKLFGEVKCIVDAM